MCLVLGKSDDGANGKPISSILRLGASEFARNIPRRQTRGATQSVIRDGRTFVPFSRVRPDLRHDYQILSPSVHQPT